MRLGKLIVSVLASTLSFVNAFQCSALSIDSLEAVDKIKIVNKMTASLSNIISTATEDDLIPIMIFRRPIPEEDINYMVMSETGMNALVYEDAELFDTVVVSQIRDTVAYSMSTNSISAVEMAASVEADKFLTAKRSITKREYVTSNEKFINNIIGDKNDIIYIGTYTSSIAVKATPAEIAKYARQSDVDQIDYFDDAIQKDELDIVLPQLNAGTSTTVHGYDGSGIKIGIIESSSGKFDASSPHLAGLGPQLTYVYNYKADGTYIVPQVTDHATKVASIIVGKAVTTETRVLEGVVPKATVYQTSSSVASDVLTGFSALVDKGVNIINYSGGSSSSGYSSYDKEIDNLIATTKVTFVKSAGNNGEKGGEITSPGKALNAITVGNARTKSDYQTALSSPYTMNASSSYLEDYYLPNKPDVTAPGTAITTIINSSTSTTGKAYSSGSGTSYAAPIVTGTLAKYMQKSSALKTNPYTAKAAIILFSDTSKISTASNSSAGNYLQDKSGAGLIDASRMLNTIFSITGTRTSTTTAATSALQFTKGQKIRIVLVFGKNSNITITNTSEMDNLNLRLCNSNNSDLAKSEDTRNNVEIIEYTIPATGIYTIKVDAKAIQNTTNGVPYSVVWMAI